MIKKLLINSAIYGLAPHVPKIISIFLLPVLTAHLTDVDYGIYGTITAYTMALAAFSTLGFNVVLQVSFYKSPCQYKVLWREIYGFLQFWMIAFAIIQGIVLYYVIPSEAIENRWAIILLTNFNDVFFGPSALLGALYYQLKQNPVPIAIRSIVAGLVTIIANYVLIVIYEWGYMGWYVGSFIGTFIVNASYSYFLNRILKLTAIYKFKTKTLFKSLKISLPIIPHYYTYFLINTSNRLVMDRAHVEISLIGEYNMAQQFASLMDFGIGAIEKATSPMCMNSIKENDEKEAKRLIYVFLLLTFSATFLFSLWGKEIFALLIKNDVLSQTYPLGAVLILALNYRPMYIAASNIYFFHEQTIKLLYITFGAGLFALIANILFIPRYGIWAAAIINYIAFLYQGYSGFVFKTFQEKSKVSYPFIKIMLLQILLSIICFGLIDAIILYKIIVSVLFIVFAIFIFIKLIKNKLYSGGLLSKK